MIIDFSPDPNAPSFPFARDSVWVLYANPAVEIPGIPVLILVPPDPTTMMVAADPATLIVGVDPAMLAISKSG